MTFDDKVSTLTSYLIKLYESRNSWEKAACMHSPIASLGSNDVHVLEILARGPSLNMGSLSEATDLPMSTLTGIVDKLVAKGFLERSRSTRDRRVVETGITPVGRQALAIRTKAHETKSRDMLSALAPTEQDQFLHLLAKITGQ